MTHSEMTCRRVTAEDTHITRRQDGVSVPVFLVPLCLPLSVPLLFPDETFSPVRGNRRAGPALPGGGATSGEMCAQSVFNAPETLVWRAQ